LLFLSIRPHHCSTLFPYTTLFRSLRDFDRTVSIAFLDPERVSPTPEVLLQGDVVRHGRPRCPYGIMDSHKERESCVTDDVALERSEEHTSELQSRGHLVCRLLLEK